MSRLSLKGDFGALIDELDVQAREYDRYAEEGDAEGMLFAAVLVESIAMSIGLLAKETARKGKEARRASVARTGNDARSRDFMTAIMQVVRTDPASDAITERFRAFDAGFRHGREGTPLRTTDDRAYVIGHRLGACAPKN